jgi:exonuclease SbcC
MKILAIRGKNLASLSSEFEVNFQNEPLASAGLFAITGPTGIRQKHTAGRTLPGTL